MVYGLGFRVWGLEFRVEGLKTKSLNVFFLSEMQRDVAW